MYPRGLVGCEKGHDLGHFLGQFDVSPVGSYIQRNAMIVGFVMGFAVIPIIYTIAEDALSAVPEHLRAASFGAGSLGPFFALGPRFPCGATGTRGS